MGSPVCLGAGNSTPSLVYPGVDVCLCMGACVCAWGLKSTSVPQRWVPSLLRCASSLLESTSYSEQGHCWMGRRAPWILDLTFLTPGVGVGQLHAFHLQPCLPQQMWGFCGFLFSPLLSRECLNHWQL